jgi:multidrug efflux pump subunit AcrB
MAFSFSTWSIRNPLPPILLFVMLTLAGLVSFALMPVTAMPTFATSDVNVVVFQPGATPSELEMEATRRVEDAVASLPGVRKVVSTVTEGQSLTAIEFDLGVGIDRAMNDVRNAVASIRQNLPATVREPIVQRADDSGRPVGIYIVEAPEMPVAELSWFVDDTVAREMMSIKGVSRVVRSGGSDQEIAIMLDPARLASLGITAADVSRELAGSNANYPGGRLILEGTEYALRTVGRAGTLDALAQTRIAVAGNQQVTLSDLGTVTLGESEARTVTRVDGRPVISFSVFKEQAFSEVDISEAVMEKLDMLAKEHHAKFRIGYTEIDFIQASYRSTLFNFIEGAILTLLVVFLFLRDWRTTAIAAITIPLSIIPTFLVMKWLGFTINFVSLLSITLVIGVLVDDAIVEIENIHRHMRQGKSPKQAAIDAAEEIGLSVIATTLVICAVFVPVSFMDGLPGLFFRQFGLTVAVAAFFSLVVARTITPMLASRWLRIPKEMHSEDGPFTERYIHIIGWTLRHRLKTMTIALLCVIASFALVPLIPTGFLPYDDYSLASVTMEVPRGSTIEQTDAAAQKLVTILRKRPEVEYVVSTVGETNGAINQARIYIKLVPPDERALSEREFSAQMYDEIASVPDMRVNFDSFSGEKDVSIALVGNDPVALSRTADALKREMRGMKGLTSVDSSEGQMQPEVVITMDPVKAAEFGITTQQVGEAISISTIGDDIPRLSKFNHLNREIPVRVRLPREYSADLGILQNLKLRTANNDSVSLSSVARLGFGNGPATIQRYDRQRRINVEANLDGSIALGTALERIDALPAMKSLPATVRVLNTGDAEFVAELMTSFLKAIGAGLLMVYAIQVLLYKDWLQPLARMMALPLSVGGAFLLLFATGNELSMPAMLGMLMLMGIADKNSILLVDAMLEQIRKGVPRHIAISNACRARARPIVMTSVAMIAGMMPFALGISPDSAFRAPMAIAVIGGLLSSTALSLIFVPVLFSYVHDLELWIAARFQQRSRRIFLEPA